MVAATKDRNTQEQQGGARAFPLAAGAKIPAGVICAADASGNLVNGSAVVAQKTVGVSRAAYDNTGGIAGAVVGEVRRGVFGPFANSAAGDLLAAGDVEATCYVVDNQTVAKTNGAGARPAAGVVHQVDATGVWVRF